MSNQMQNFLIRDFQAQIRHWADICFGPAVAADRVTRNYRFLEEALELVQACGCSKADALQLVDYVYGRPAGEPAQEVGGVLTTLAALCSAREIDMQDRAIAVVDEVWENIDKIRTKQATKLNGSPLPGPGIRNVGMSKLDARLMLVRHNRFPKETEEGYWRWTKPDPPCDIAWPTRQARECLPGIVFDCLAGDDYQQPWLFSTYDRAMWHAENAVLLAMSRGTWSPEAAEQAGKA